jgi:hypothetical protein
MHASSTALSRLRAVATLSILAGCAHPVTMPRYVAPPPSTATARLVMHNHLRAGDYYLVNVYADAQVCTGTQRVGTSQGAADPPATTLATDRWQTLEVMVLMPGNRYCVQRWSFVPRAGRSYSLTTTSSPAGCSALVYDASDPTAPRLETSLRKRNAEGRVCVPLATATPILADKAPEESVVASDLPIDSGAREPAAPRPPPAPPAVNGKTSDQVTADDLRGLIGH